MESGRREGANIVGDKRRIADRITNTLVNGYG